MAYIPYLWYNEEMQENYLSWAFFGTLLLILFCVDLFFHRDNKKMSFGTAVSWSIGWITIALLFNVWVYFTHGKEAGASFLAGYLVEESLSIDNLFVFLLIFKAFNIPPKFRHKVLFWGILGAIIMRAIFIAGGIMLVTQFQWLFYVFGAFLVFTGIKLATQDQEEMHPEKNPLILWLQKWLPVVHETHSGNFFIKQAGKTFATPLFLALIAVEISDLIFAVDSIPAILGITTDPFIVYTSNIFAILGLRSLYFTLEGMMDLFHYLHYGLSAILIFIGLKMLLADFFHIPISWSLLFIGSCLLLSILASLLHKPKTPA